MSKKKKLTIAEKKHIEKEEFFKIVRNIFPKGTQHKFGNYVGVSQGTISKWHQGILPVPYYAKVIMAHLMERNEGGFDPFLDVESYFKDHS